MTVDAHYSELIARLFPETPIQSVVTIEFGWASKVLVLNDKYVIKIPRNEDSREGLEKEIIVTSHFGQYIRTKVPRFISQARNEKLLAVAYELIDGFLLTNQDVDGTPTKRLDDLSVEGVQSDLALQLAEILNSIHSINLRKASEILQPFVRETWVEKNQLRINEFRNLSVTYFDEYLAEKCTSYLDDLEKAIMNFNYPPRFIHGDFGGWNILYSPEKQEIVGLLDWADARIGDPAADFVELIYDFGLDFAKTVLEHYRYSRKGILERANSYLALAGFQDLKYGLETESDYFIERGKNDILKLLK